LTVAVQEEEAARRAAEDEARAAEERLRELQRKMAEQVSCCHCNDVQPLLA